MKHTMTEGCFGAIVDAACGDGIYPLTVDIEIGDTSWCTVKGSEEERFLLAMKARADWYEYYRSVRIRARINHENNRRFFRFIDATRNSSVIDKLEIPLPIRLQKLKAKNFLERKVK